VLPPRSAFAGFRFPPDVIVVGVRWYLRFNLSNRDIEELLAERGVEVDHVSVFRWVHRFTTVLADAARFARHAPGDRWDVRQSRSTHSHADVRAWCCSCRGVAVGRPSCVNDRTTGVQA